MAHGRRILLLEDDPEEARSARNALIEAGYAVVLAPTLAKAREAAHDERGYDLVIVDHQLPDGEGPRIIPYLRAAGVQAPVVMVTGNRSDRVAEMAFEMGCVDTAVKDLDYHLWLPRMAEAVMADPARADDSDPRWGPHVKGVAVGRVHGQSVHRVPAELWAPLAPALQAATDLAVRALRGTGHSVLGSVPFIHVRLTERQHLLVVVRGGVFAAALLTAEPTEADRAEVAAEATAFARARAESEGAEA
jgi:CheY-like chemotaxis protein